jgi:hypothetical protein
MNTTNGTKVLVRSRKGRMVAGICAGVAGFLGWEGEKTSIAEDLISKSRHGSPG